MSSMAVSVRHAVVSLRKREDWYEDIRPSAGGSDFNPLAASGMIGNGMRKNECGFEHPSEYSKSLRDKRAAEMIAPLCYQIVRMHQFSV